MSTDVDQNSEPVQNHRDDEFQKLEQDYRRLQEQTQELISERTHIESELRNLKKQAGRLEEEVRHLRAPPLIVGTLQDVLDPERAIVRSSNGTVFQVSLNQRIEPELLKPGTRVALNQDNLSLVEVLHDAWDPIVSGSEMVEKPDITYDMVAGLDDEILSVREAIELPLTKPHLFAKVGIKPPKGVLLVDRPVVEKRYSQRLLPIIRTLHSSAWLALNLLRSTSEKGGGLCVNCFPWPRTRLLPLSSSMK